MIYIACAFLVMSMGFLIFHENKKSEWTHFFKDLTIEQNIAITKELQKRGVPFTLKRHGRDIWIPKHYASSIEDILNHTISR